MKIVAWNAMGFHDENSLEFAYVFWIFCTHHPMFLVLLRRMQWLFFFVKDPLILLLLRGLIM